MNPGGAPHRGPAPAPSREITLDGSPSTVEVDPASLTVSSGPPDPRPEELEVSPSPENPEEAVRQSTAETREGELIAAIGKEREKFQAEMEEQRLFYETQLAALQANLRQAPPAQGEAPKFDPEAPVNAGYLWDVLNNIEPYMENRILRSTWDVTSEEETKVLQTNPAIANLPDGVQKSQLIQRAVQLLRRKEGSNGEVKADDSNTSPASKRPKQPQNTRNVSSRVVPHVEASTRPRAADLRPEDGTMDIMKAYAEADKIQDKEERLRVKKKLFKDAQARAGISDEQLSKMQFSSS